MPEKELRPVLRGMGGKDDFVTEPFVPGDDLKAKQAEMAGMMIAAGMDPEEASRIFAVPPGLDVAKKPTAL